MSRSAKRADVKTKPPSKPKTNKQKTVKKNEDDAEWMREILSCACSEQPNKPVTVEGETRIKRGNTDGFDKASCHEQRASCLLPDAKGGLPKARQRQTARPTRKNTREQPKKQNDNEENKKRRKQGAEREELDE